MVKCDAILTVWSHSLKKIVSAQLERSPDSTPSTTYRQTCRVLHQHNVWFTQFWSQYLLRTRLCVHMCQCSYCVVLTCIYFSSPSWGPAVLSLFTFRWRSSRVESGFKEPILFPSILPDVHIQSQSQWPEIDFICKSKGLWSNVTVTLEEWGKKGNIVLEKLDVFSSEATSVFKVALIAL